MAGYALAVQLGWADGPYTDEDALDDARHVYRALERCRLRRTAFVARRRPLVRGTPAASLSGRRRF
jgi:hypothetical protein